MPTWAAGGSFGSIGGILPVASEVTTAPVVDSGAAITVVYVKQ